MHSPPHRANLLDPRLDAVGIAVVERDGELFAVEDFARTVQALTQRQQEQQVARVLAGQGLDVRPDPSIARSYCGDAPVRVRPLPRLIMNYTTTDLGQLPRPVKERIASGHVRTAAVGACRPDNDSGFAAYHIVLLLY
jgi:hypothetical protein